jgi:hypothetical protein
MAVDQASAKDGEGEPAITGFVRAVTQPGGMNIDWKRVGAAGSIYRWNRRDTRPQNP